ncbi:outer membrane beta-barrel family protein [Pedobacter alluvionis]|uniref:Outer membrane receptor protein involved in Fe transport n=1 Tax=Pedobacter alluvionis TaxID=475253 RepID=A0A497XVU0_9SPHI|nr:outer membrane beta-barrel family protein [Pedobacter alluvionis]RLJ72733.1 outer membrane receptor protein involved in Fe transport [Pedobacter alluvionis]TFB29427.1 TonB-dependent receptor [Pedobacter alluvionis]
MRKLLVIIFFLLFLATSNIFAQSSSTIISGKIVDEENKPIPGSSVTLLNLKDSVVVKIIPSDNNGQFSFDFIKNGGYFLKVSSLGFNSYRSEIIIIPVGQERFDAGNIKLKSKGQDLAAVEIKAIKPLVEVRADRMILNVSSSINAVGSNALELLGKSPMVRVDNSRISVNGKNGVSVYIDGKPTNLGGSDLASVLTGIQSSSIDAIEIITNPSAKYPAAGNAGIINIRLKKDKSLGFNGNVSFTSSFAHTPKYDGSINLNYRDKKYNVFGSYGYQYGKNRTLSDFFREVNNNNVITTLDQSAIYTRTNDNHNYRGGIDLFLSGKSTLGFLINGGLQNGPFTSQSSTNIYTGTNVLDSILNSSNNQTKNLRRINYNGNYQYQDAEGRSLGIDADYTSFKNDLNALLPNEFVRPDNSLIRKNNIRTSASTDIDIKSIKADYEQKALSGKLSFGLNYNDVSTRNSFQYFNAKNSNPEVLDPAQTRDFSYKEKVSAAYLSYNRDFKKINFQIGLRAEQTAANGGLTTIMASNYRNVDTSYTNLFPNGSINLVINKYSSLGFSYSRRIDRPSYEDLNPFITPLDELTFSQGNSFLKPQYTDNYQFTYKYKIITAIAGYSHVKDYFTQVLDTLAGNKSIQTVKNIPVQNVFNLGVTAQFSITKWWSNYSFLSISNTRFAGNLNKAILDIDQTKLFIYNDNTFVLPKSWSTQLTTYYNGPSLNGATRYGGMWTLDYGIQKKLFNDNAIFKLLVTDVFNTLRTNGLINFSGTYLRSHFQTESRQLRLSFTYRFGEKTVKQARKRTTSAESESKRLKGQN